MANKKYSQFTAGTVTQDKIFLLADPTTGALVKVTVAQLTTQKTIAFADTPYTVLATDYTIFGNCNGGDINCILPLAASFPGRILVFKKIDSGGDRVILNPAGGNSIESVGGNYNINIQFETAIIQSDGTTNWWVIGEAI